MSRNTTANYILLEGAQLQHKKQLSVVHSLVNAGHFLIPKWFLEHLSVSSLLSWLIWHVVMKVKVWILQKILFFSYFASALSWSVCQKWQEKEFTFFFSLQSRFFFFKCHLSVQSALLFPLSSRWKQRELIIHQQNTGGNFYFGKCKHLYRRQEMSVAIFVKAGMNCFVRSLHVLNVKAFPFAVRCTLFIRIHQKCWNPSRLTTNPKVPSFPLFQHEPYLMLRDAPNAKGNDRFHGYVADFTELLSERVGFRYRLKLVSDGRWGTRQEDGTWAGMTGEVLRHVSSSTSTEHQNFVSFCSKFCPPDWLLLKGINFCFRRQTSLFQLQLFSVIVREWWISASPSSWRQSVCTNFHCPIFEQL